jgi:predicted alpha/beta-hydrolase family hydrolase
MMNETDGQASRERQENPATLSIEVDAGHAVSALLLAPPGAHACFVFGHGAGAGMKHLFMTAVAIELAARGVATLRYQFPYMERGSRRTDPPALCHATVRAAVVAASRELPGVALFAGGKSFGGRMTSQAQAESPLAGVRGLAFLGFPLHAAGKPSGERAAHLRDVGIPMLFLQGTRDELASRALLDPVVQGLGALAQVKWFVDADHSFHVPARTGKNDRQVLIEVVTELAQWMKSSVSHPVGSNSRR